MKCKLCGCQLEGDEVDGICDMCHRIYEDGKE